MRKGNYSSSITNKMPSSPLASWWGSGLPFDVTISYCFESRKPAMLPRVNVVKLPGGLTVLRV